MGGDVRAGQDGFRVEGTKVGQEVHLVEMVDELLIRAGRVGDCTGSDALPGPLDRGIDAAGTDGVADQEVVMRHAKTAREGEVRWGKGREREDRREREERREGE